MYSIRSEAHFDAAHFLAGHDGKCRNIHGHRWVLEAEVAAQELITEGPLRGMVSDFALLRKDLNAIADQFDHTLIYESGTLWEETIDALRRQEFALTEVSFRPTAEHLAEFVFDRLTEMGYTVLETAVDESPANRAVYRRGSDGWRNV